MKETIIKLKEIESMAHKLQRRVLKEMISKAINETIIDFLNDLLEDQIDTPSFTTLLDKIYELKFYTLNIGSKVPNDFPNTISYHFRIRHDRLVCCKLIFTINNNVIEDIKYEVK
jgi:hypothetical protein